MEGLDAKWLFTCAVVLAFHFNACGGKLTSIQGKILQQWTGMEAASGESLVEENRVDQAFHALRQKLARLSTECTLHALCITLLWLLYELGASPGRAQAVRLAAAMCPYTLNFLIARQKIELTKLNLRISYSIYVLTFVVFVLAGATSFDSTDRVAMQAFQLSCRFSMSVFFLDTALLVPWQVLVSLAECWTYREGATTFALAQLLVVAITGLLSLSLELGVRSHLRASLASADEQSMLRAFRNVLRGICDGDLLLNKQLHICGEASKLEQLLMTGTSLQNRSFWDLIQEDSREEFRRFLQATSEAGGVPSCLRTSLRGSCNIRVAVDIFHVPLPDLFGDMHHLIAFREDVETRPLPEALEDVDVALLEQLAAARDMPAGAPSDTSRKLGSRCSDDLAAACMFSSFPALSEMTLLVDTSTLQCDITQAHLKYRPSELSCMPSLRKLTLPVEWETVRSRLSRYARKVQQGRTEPKSFEGMRLRMLEDPRRLLVANTARLMPLEKQVGPPLLWLHIGDLVEDSTRCRLPPDLAGIRESMQTQAKSKSSIN